eukprot:jgi/Picre1/31627/NNA_006978.t1
MSTSLAEEEAVELFNTIQLEHGAAEKTKLLKSLTEIVVRREPRLIDIFVGKVLELQIDKSPAVRKAVLDFYDASLSAAVTADTLLLGAECVVFLLRDDNVGTLKRCIRSLISIYQLTLALSASIGNQESGEGGTLWNKVEEAVNMVESMVVDENSSTGFKLSAAKFLEQGLIFASGDKVPACLPVLDTPTSLPLKGSIVSKQDAVKSSNGILTCLIKLLKFVKGSGSSGPLTVSCIRVVSTILKARPQFAGRILPVLLSFTKEEAFQKGGEGKAIEALEECLRAFGESDISLATPWQKKISDALVTMSLDPLQKIVKRNELKRAREGEPDSAPSVRQRSGQVNRNDKIIGEKKIEIQNYLLNYDADGLFQHIHTTSSGVIADLVLDVLSTLQPPKSSHHADLISDRVCNLMIGALKSVDGQVDAKEEENVLPMRVFKDPLTPIDMNDDIASEQRLKVLNRLISTTSSSNIELRKRIIARLLTLFPDMDNCCEVTVSGLLNDYVGRHGHEILCLWLTMLFVELLENGEDDVEISDLISGSQYEQVLQSIIEEMRQKLPPTDKSLPNLLQEAPVLPLKLIESLVQSCLQDLNGWESTGLIVARDVILSRAQIRDRILELALEACTSTETELRTKAIRMCTNQLFGHGSLDDKIESAALNFLKMLPTDESDSEQAKADADRLASLYSALCTKKSSLITELFATFCASQPAVKEVLSEKCANIVHVLGPNDETLLGIIQASPEEYKDVVIIVINALSESMPPRALVEKVLKFFDTCHDPLLILPILPSLKKQEAIKLIPYLILLPVSSFTDAVKRLCTTVYEGQNDPVITPAEILTILHMVDDKKSSTLRHTIAAINVCLEMREYFTAEVLAASLSQLITRIPLPQLFMRTVLQSISLAPKLKSFIVGLLGDLVSKQIWTNSTQFKGWILAAQQTAPDSFPVMVRLPANILPQAITGLQSDTQSSLAEFALSEKSLDLSDNAKKILSRYRR